MFSICLKLSNSNHHGKKIYDGKCQTNCCAKQRSHHGNNRNAIVARGCSVPCSDRYTDWKNLKTAKSGSNYDTYLKTHGCASQLQDNDAQCPDTTKSGYDEVNTTSKKNLPGAQTDTRNKISPSSSN